MEVVPKPFGKNPGGDFEVAGGVAATLSGRLDTTSGRTELGRFPSHREIFPADRDIGL
jgi:hypothetical protein